MPPIMRYDLFSCVSNGHGVRDLGVVMSIKSAALVINGDCPLCCAVIFAFYIGADLLSRDLQSQGGISSGKHVREMGTSSNPNFI